MNKFGEDEIQEPIHDDDEYRQRVLVAQGAWPRRLGLGCLWISLTLYLAFFVGALRLYFLQRDLELEILGELRLTLGVTIACLILSLPLSVVAAQWLRAGLILHCIQIATTWIFTVVMFVAAEAWKDVASYHIELGGSILLLVVLVRYLFRRKQG